MNRSWLAAFLAWCALAPGSASAPLETNTFVLNSGSGPEWNVFSEFPERGSKLRLEFRASANPDEQTLLIEQEDVRYLWSVLLNGKKLGQLMQLDQAAVQTLSIPPGTLRSGENVLEIEPPTQGEQILIKRVEIISLAAKDYITQANVVISVTEAGEPLPSRITIATPSGALAPLNVETNAATATRVGVVYTGNGKASIGLPAGRHVVYASRGPEYSVSTNVVELKAGEQRELNLELRREVDTAGWVAADTHIHTFTHSRHGDATIEERVVTLAGEGIEFAVATDHNTHVDLRPAMKAAGVEKFFTTVTGNEVTTRKGHFNAFPIEPSARVPDFRIEDWSRLIPAIRQTPNVRVVIMNHPTDVHAGFRPFASTNFHPVTAQNRHGQTYLMDAIELINSAALQSDQTEVFEKWFALLNSGQRIVGVGASDSHEVTRFIVGQGRTYIRAPDDNAADISADVVCSNLLAGQAVASMGLFLDVKANGQHGIGSLVPARGQEITIEVSVRGASWARADKAQFFANGVQVAEMEVPSPQGAGLKGNLLLKLPKREHDYWVTVIASGNGEIGPFWTLAKPYQANSTNLTPKLYAISNPIWVDADGDGKFISPREQAVALVEASAGDNSRLVAALASREEIVAAHAASLLSSARLDDLVSGASALPAQMRRGIESFRSPPAAGAASR